MKGIWTVFFFLPLSLPLSSSPSSSSHPHIVLIVADDLGWNDIGFNNPAIISPNIDKLAASGLILNQSYVQPLCSPSRAALMTGVYPFRMGLQHLIIFEEQAVCVPLNRTLLPEVLKRQGYATHMVGKWHLGFCQWGCTPTRRGFDSFYGYYNYGEDYYQKNHTMDMTPVDGYDFRRDRSVERSAAGNYSTYQYTARVRQIITGHDVTTPLFMYLAYQNVHAPLQVPRRYYDMYPGAPDDKRRTLSGMVTALDDAVGAVRSALEDKGMLNNTLIVFTTDNGGWLPYAGNNYPLRGGKYTVFEGGTRGVAFVHGNMLSKTGVRYDGLMHIVDWLPTLAEAAGVQESLADLDGVSQWKSLMSLSVPSARHEVIYNMDYTVAPLQGRAAIRVGDFKLVDGYPGIYPDWYKPGQYPPLLCSNPTLASDTRPSMPADMDVDAPSYQYLFNLKVDPAEHDNIYDKFPQVVKDLQAKLDAHKAKMVDPNYPLDTHKADPTNWAGAWSPGWC